MNLFENFHFIRPLWLVLIPVSIFIWWQLLKLDNPLKGWVSRMESELLEALVVGDRVNNRYVNVGLLCVWLLACLSVAGPTWQPEPLPFSDDPAPIMIVLSAKDSMTGNDFSPSRLERAHLKIADIISESKGEPVGLIAFAGSAHLVLPPTRDASIVATMASEITPGIMPEAGDDLVAALELARKSMGNQPGTAIVVTDEVSEQIGALESFRRLNDTPVQFLAIANSDTSAIESIYAAANAIRGRVTPLTDDSSDVKTILKQVKSAPIAVSSNGSIQWSESGWWLVPLISIVVAFGFRKEIADG